MKMKKWGCRGIAGLLVFSFWLFCSFLSGTIFGAAEGFPKKEITIIVNLGPGGGRDILARGVGKTMSKYLGVPVVVMNIVGAGGARGLISLYNSQPDGYTIGMGMATDIIDQIIEKREYDNKKFTYIGRAQASPTFYFVRSDSPFRSVKDFKSFGKPIRYSTYSITSPPTVTSMVIAKREGFPLVLVGGYQASAAALLGVIRGEVEFTGIQLPAAISFVRSGQIRPVLTIDEKRHPSFPDIPTVVEVGYPELIGLGGEFWFMGPPGVPKARIQTLEDALMKTLKDPEFVEWAKGANVDPAPLSGEEMTKKVFKLFELFEQYKGDIEKYMKK